jgi:magnesium-protoporphyrin IX monomethyl ester (oxidative) cyclase
MQDSLNILLIKVPEVDFEEKKISYAESLALDAPPMPLGIASLSAYLKKMTSHSIHLLDMFAEGFESYSERHDRNALIDVAERRIMEVMPDVIGISALMIINYKWVHHIAGLAKKIKPDVKVIVGGGYAAILPEKVLEDGNIDFIVIGEGEEVILNILASGFDRQKLAGADGIGFRDVLGRKVINRKPASIRDLDVLPFYDWEGMGLEKYMRYHKNRFVSYITSRGCPFGCSFCSTHLLWGKKFRPFSHKRVLDEIDYLKRTYGIEEIEFRDDNLTLDRERITAILSGFIERDYRFTWTTPNAVAIVTLDAPLVGLMKKSGCEMLTIAIESGSERVLKEIIHKPVSKDKAREVRRIARESGLKIQTAFIIGFPGETKEEIEETKNFAAELQCDWNQISIATPFPGTEMYEICEKNNFFVKADSDLERYRYGFANIRTGEFDEKWLKEKAYSINIEVNFIRNHNLEDDPVFAVEQFADILSRYPKHLIGIICLAYAYRKAGETGLARETIGRAVELAERDPEIYETYGKYIDAGNPVFGEFLALRKGRADASEARSEEAV